VQSPLLTVFIINWELVGVKTLRTIGQSSSEVTSCRWLQFRDRLHFNWKSQTHSGFERFYV